MPCMSTFEKSIDRISAAAWSRSVPVTPSASSATRVSETSSAIAITPMVVGRRTKRSFSHATSAVTTRHSEAISSMALS